MLVQKKKSGCLGWIVTWLASAFAVWLTARVVPGVEVADFETALWAALALGLLNSIVRPILVVLTLPVTVLTLGLFLLVINGGMIALAASLLDGFSVAGAVPAILAAVVLTVVSTVVGWFVGGSEKKKKD
jgi:putative membrane protein